MGSWCFILCHLPMHESLALFINLKIYIRSWLPSEDEQLSLTHRFKQLFSSLILTLSHLPIPNIVKRHILRGHQSKKPLFSGSQKSHPFWGLAFWKLLPFWSWGAQCGLQFCLAWPALPCFMLGLWEHMPPRHSAEIGAEMPLGPGAQRIGSVEARPPPGNSWALPPAATVTGADGLSAWKESWGLTLLLPAP